MAFDTFDWDDEIEVDDGFTLIDEGDYDFTVEKFERARFDGSSKVPACPKAILTLKILDDSGKCIITILDNMLLYKKNEWRLSQFFRSIGQKKEGQKVKMNWQQVVGSRGRCHVYQDTFKSNKDGKEITNNKISQYYDPPKKSAYEARIDDAPKQTTMDPRVNAETDW